jgi:hypothetical protein
MTSLLRKMCQTALALGLAACSGGTPSGGAPSSPEESSAPLVTRICDGSTDIRLLYMVGGGGQIEAGSVVMSENGHALLAVDGQCRFGAYRDRWSEVRAGVLSETDEARLAETLELSKWSSWKGDWGGGGVDGGTATFRFGADAIVFGGGGPGSEPPFDRRTLNASLDAAFDEILSGYPAPTGPGRIVVVRREADDVKQYPKVPWPASLDPESIALSWGEAYALPPGSSTLTSAEDGEAFRSARAAYLRGDHGQMADWGASGMSFETEAARYGVWFRDVFPFEDPETGLVSF